MDYNNIQHQLNIQPNFVVNITPEMYELVDDAFATLESNELTKPINYSDWFGITT